MKEELEKLGREWVEATWAEIVRQEEIKKLQLKEKPNRYRIQKAREAITSFREDNS
jgi:hypothetical protein